MGPVVRCAAGRNQVLRQAPGRQWPLEHAAAASAACEQAKQYLREVEARVARGLVGIPEPTTVPPAGELMAAWAMTLVNRNAKDDRGRLEKHLKPAWAREGARGVV